MRLWICIAMLLTFGPIGCSKQSRDAQANTEDSARVTAESGSGKDTQPCFGCNARGSTVCFGGCKSGELECPGPCLKLTRGKWEKLQVAGHDPNELWQKFPDGPKGWTAWTSAHVGEVIVVQNGKAVNTGKCQRCGGTAKVKCTVCGGKGERLCDFCEGKKVVPISWNPTNNPALFRQPDLIRLKDGRVLLGRVAMKSGANYTIRTRDGKMVDVRAADILPKIPASTNNAAL